MTIRTVVTIALATALLAASLPVVERTRVQHANARVAGEVERLETVARSLASENDLVHGDGQPAHVRLTLHLPVESWGASAVETVRLPPPGEPGDVTWQVAGGEPQQRTIEGVAVAGPPGGLVLADGGRQRLRLELRPRNGQRTVVIRRPPAAGG